MPQSSPGAEASPPQATAATVQARPLTARAFARYGDVAEPGRGDVKMIRDGQVRLSKSAAVFDHSPETVEHTLDFYEVPATEGQLVATMIERHARSTQMFSPMAAARWLVVIWPEGPEGPAEAFVARPDQVVTYHPGVWHHGIVALDRAATFASTMWKAADRQGDTDFVPLPAPVTITWPDE